jgi:hypothetical protein
VLWPRLSQALVLQGGLPTRSTHHRMTLRAFVLHERSVGMTRVLVRERYCYTRWWAPLLFEPVEMVSFVMSHKMVRGIRDRAERRSDSAEAAPGGG